jgi:hypothetical protein
LKGEDLVSGESKPALDYARRLFDNLLKWYDNADAKAERILTIDGVFLSFLTGSIFMKQDDLTKVVGHFRIDNWVLLASMCLCLTGSIVCALMCLWSRTYRRGARAKLFRVAGVDVENSDTYTPEVMWFFQLIGGLNPQQFRRRVESVGSDFEVQALAAQISELSQNVSRKHFWVNCGFVLTGLSLILFLASGVSYLLRVQG